MTSNAELEQHMRAQRESFVLKSRVGGNLTFGNHFR